MMAAATPSPLWFATRGAGTATLLLLTAVVALGILTAGLERREERIATNDSFAVTSRNRRSASA